MSRQSVQRQSKSSSSWAYVPLGVALILVGVVILIGGVQLVSLGGSWYYLIAGLGLATSGALLCRRDIRSVWLFAVVYAATIVWAIWEAGLAFWPQVPRLAPFLVMGAAMAGVMGKLDASRRKLGRRLALSQLSVIAVGLVAMFFAHGSTHPGGDLRYSNREFRSDAEAEQTDWQFYGRDTGATHFVPFDQINRENVASLEVAWTFRTGEINESADFQATPLQIDDSVYFCTAHNRIFALDADTGREKWSFDPHVKALVCRPGNK